MPTPAKTVYIPSDRSVSLWEVLLHTHTCPQFLGFAEVKRLLNLSATILRLTKPNNTGDAGISFLPRELGTFPVKGETEYTVFRKLRFGGGESRGKVREAF